ncbi:MAG: 16S rRNA (cytosine(1402)-N(4))-methyltransferase [Clostridiales bacterium]|nr:MAG: 16S rRNA (cytosine(1402)-N(4))-methyltransferase [Clostridiales bacterium]
MSGHISVMYNECMAALKPGEGKLIVDGTLGGGGHSKGILDAGCRLIGIDKDADAITRCRKKFSAYEGRFALIHDDFKNLSAILKELQVESIDGALLDLGVSSYQLDEEERGFSYSADAPLDMRMNRESEKDARTVLNTYSEDELRRILYEYGEEKFAPRIAKMIVERRPLSTTGELADIIKDAIPAAARRKGGNPSKRTFQAIRIEVNDELSGLERALNDYIDALSEDGVLAVISFHSLEDRIVKKVFRKAEDPCECPKDFPQCVCGKKAKGKAIPRKPVLPTAEETENNPRSRSAKLRIFVRGCRET